MFAPPHSQARTGQGEIVSLIVAAADANALGLNYFRILITDSLVDMPYW